MEVLKHECGVAMVRLLKPLEYYHQKYGTWMYGLNKLYLLMEKQHNRKQRKDKQILAYLSRGSATSRQYGRANSFTRPGT